MHNYASSRKTVELINERPERIHSYFGVTTLTESDTRTRNKRNPFFLLLISAPSFFLHQCGTHNQHTNSLSDTLPSFLHPSPCASLYPAEKERNAIERGDVAVSSAEHKVPFVFRFRDLPRTSIAVGAAVRAFLHPRPTG